MRLPLEPAPPWSSVHTRAQVDHPADSFPFPLYDHLFRHFCCNPSLQCSVSSSGFADIYIYILHCYENDILLATNVSVRLASLYSHGLEMPSLATKIKHGRTKNKNSALRIACTTYLLYLYERWLRLLNCRNDGHSKRIIRTAIKLCSPFN